MSNEEKKEKKDRTIYDDLSLLLDKDILIEDKILYIPKAVEDDEGDKVYIISDETIRDAMQKLYILDKYKTEIPINIIFNTSGGDVTHGMILYDAIKNCNSFIEMTVKGTAYSMGSVILQAAGHRVMSNNAKLMMHAGYDAIDGHPKDVDAWHKMAHKDDSSIYKVFQDKFKNINRDRTLPQSIVHLMERFKMPLTGKGFTIKEIELLFDHDLILTAKEAKKMNLIDEIEGEKNE